nr:MAG TPA: Terminase large subunit [Caudoviricetes sp.]
MTKKSTKEVKPKKTKKEVEQKSTEELMVNNSVHRFISTYKKNFEEMYTHCKENNWVFHDDIESLYKAEVTVVNILLDRIKYFVKKFDAYLKYKYVQEFIDLMSAPVKLYMQRYIIYIEKNLLLNIKDVNRRISEMEFQNKMTVDFNRISDRYYELDINKEDTDFDLPIRAEKKIPFLMKDMIEELYPKIKTVRENFEKNEKRNLSHTVYDVSSSTELFKNIKNPPPYDPDKHYYEQSKDVIEFYSNELEKIRHGVTIAGVFIHPLLYWHMNFFKTDIPMAMFEGTPLYNPNKQRLITNPFIRDNELYFIDTYARAEKENKGVFLFGTRRFGKALWIKEKIYNVDGSTKNIEEVKVGDKILGKDGRPTSVLGVYPQGVKKLYRVTLVDGRNVLCCDEHLWEISQVSKHNLKTVFSGVLPLKEIIKGFNTNDYFLPKSPKEFYQGEQNTKIKSVVYEREDEAVCIEVDNESHCFLTTNAIVTHNTVIESSLLTWRTTLVENSESLVIGGSADDLEKLTKTINIAFTNIHPAFFLERNGTSWEKGVEFGLKKKDNLSLAYSNIYIRNVASGTNSGTVKTAGATPTAWICDEGGKFNCAGMYLQAVPSFQNPKGWGVIPLISGTGGNEVLSSDAQMMLSDPAAYKLLVMDWDLLESYVPEERFITWKRRAFSMFAPAQMSYKEGLVKDITNMADLKKVDDENLKKIEVHITNWELANKRIEEDRALVKNDRTALAQEKMGYPIDPVECFVNRVENPFCAREGDEHLKDIRERGNLGKKVDVVKSDDGGLQTYFSDKDLAPFPFKGGNIDAPVVIFEDPPKEPKFDFTYVAGLDAYKHDKSNTDSVGVLYIFKRAVNIKDPFANRIVAVYASRPDRIETFNKTCEMLLEGYGAQCLMENADISFQIYLRQKGKDTRLLANGEELVQRQINPKATQNNKVGMNTSVVNQRYIFNLVQNYTNSWITVGHTVEGEAIEKRGIVRIPDEGLLQELISYYPGMNADRLVAFGHALALADYWDSLNLLPKKKIEQDDNYFRRQSQELKQFESPYSSNIISPYSNQMSVYGDLEWLKKSR